MIKPTEVWIRILTSILATIVIMTLIISITQCEHERIRTNERVKQATATEDHL
jgi:Mg2+/citrate symporter